MFKQRYLIVEYHAELEGKYHKNPLDENGRFQNWLHIHHLLGTYHWSRLDINHVVVTAHFAVSNQKQLQDDDKVSVLPHVSSSKKIKNVVKKPKHWQALMKKLSVDNNSSMDDILDALEENHGAVFAPIR